MKIEEFERIDQHLKESPKATSIPRLKNMNTKVYNLFGNYKPRNNEKKVTIVDNSLSSETPGCSTSQSNPSVMQSLDFDDQESYSFSELEEDKEDKRKSLIKRKNAMNYRKQGEHSDLDYEDSNDVDNTDVTDI